MLRITGGHLKNRRLQTPKGATTRPTSEMMRKGLFDICQNAIEGARFLDLFAGSGAMGIEALSRGAAYACFIERDRAAFACLKKNLQDLDLVKQSKVICSDAYKALHKGLGAPFDIVYVDPPYAHDLSDLMPLILEKKIVSPEGHIFLETSERTDLSQELEGFQLISDRKYGSSRLYQMRLPSRK